MHRCGRCNCDPMLAKVRLHCILQLAVFIFCPLTGTPSRPINARIQGMLPSATTLYFRSTRTSAVIAAQSLPPCICTESFSLSSSSSVHLPARPAVKAMLGFKASYHLFQHCFFVRPGTRSEMFFQFLPPCICTASFSLLSSTAIHVPLRLAARSMLISKASCHLLQHCILVRPETSAAIESQFFPPCACTASFSLMSSSSVHLTVR
jgi:hypothetical protein